MEHDSSSHHEISITKSGCNSSDPSVEVPNMVCNSPNYDGRLATPTTSLTINPTELSTNRVEHFWQRLNSQAKL